MMFVKFASLFECSLNRDSVLQRTLWFYRSSAFRSARDAVATVPDEIAVASLSSIRGAAHRAATDLGSSQRALRVPRWGGRNQWRMHACSSQRKPQDCRTWLRSSPSLRKSHLGEIAHILNCGFFTIWNVLETSSWDVRTEEISGYWTVWKMQKSGIAISRKGSCVSLTVFEVLML